jgi:hypothetical protein
VTISFVPPVIPRAGSARRAATGPAGRDRAPLALPSLAPGPARVVDIVYAVSAVDKRATPADQARRRGGGDGQTGVRAEPVRLNRPNHPHHRTARGGHRPQAARPPSRGIVRLGWAVAPLVAAAFLAAMAVAPDQREACRRPWNSAAWRSRRSSSGTASPAPAGVATGAVVNRDWLGLAVALGYVLALAVLMLVANWLGQLDPWAQSPSLTSATEKQVCRCGGMAQG